MRQASPLLIRALALLSAATPAAEGPAPAAPAAPPPPAVLLPDGPARMDERGAPEGWSSVQGATTGTYKWSECLPGPQGGVLLRGDASTGQWRSLVATAPLREKTSFRLSFEARASGLRVEGKQFDNCYVAMGLPDDTTRRFAVIQERGWTGEEFVIGTPERVASCIVTIFLSKTGTLEVRGMRLEELRPEDSYAILVRHMGRYYSHFDSKKIDWPKLAAAHRAAAEGARDEAGFVEKIRALLAELKDVHVVVRGSDGRVIPTFAHVPEGNADFRAVRETLIAPSGPGRIALAGTAGKDLGYLAVFSLPQSEQAFAPVVEALEGMLDRRGILLDLRACSGGNEQRALELAAYFAGSRTVYARTRVRSGPAPSDLSPPTDRVLVPRQGRRFEGPVVCLLGPGCVSSGEGFAQMMAAIPGVVTAGKPTAGFSGNPGPVDLPNGVSVGFSRWVDLLPDGTPLEGRGVVPSRVIEHAGPGDPTFEAGLRLLEEMASKAGK